MRPEQILAEPARILTQAQREHYFEHGFVGVQDVVPADILAELQKTTADFVETSKGVSASDDRFDVGAEHSPENPILRRLKNPDEQSEAYWNFSTGLMADIAADLVGPNVVFHHSKLNFKWFDASDTVKWHQDIQALGPRGFSFCRGGPLLTPQRFDLPDRVRVEELRKSGI